MILRPTVGPEATRSAQVEQCSLGGEASDALMSEPDRTQESKQGTAVDVCLALSPGRPAALS